MIPQKSLKSAFATAVLLGLAATAAPAAPTASTASAPATPSALSSASVTGSTTALTPFAPGTGADWQENAYRGSVHVVPGPEKNNRKFVRGTVFVDRNQNSRQDKKERGLAGVTVSNGLDVTTTDKKGNYKLPVRDNMNVFVTQPAGYRVPVDEDNIPQFSYTHLPEGSPTLKYGGIEPTGGIPKQVNFPLAKDRLTNQDRQNCVVAGDVQTYNKKEVEYAHAGGIKDLANRDDYAGCGVIFVGDIVGDDLSLYPDIRTMTARLNGPAWLMPGNHDMDFDAPSRDHAYDTYRNQFGPTYYSYDSGKAHVIALETVDYPLAGASGYNASIDEDQLRWLARDLARVPKSKTIVLAGHVPLLDFADAGSTKHQIDQVKKIYSLLLGRKVVSLGGHTHSLENLRAGDSLTEWSSVMGVDKLPFTHLTVGAISGDWYKGKLNANGVPSAVQRDGAYPGILTLEFNKNSLTERFTVRGESADQQMSLGLNTPRYRNFFEEFKNARGKGHSYSEPMSVTRSELKDSWLTTNFWMGSSGASVRVSIDGAPAVEAERTQPMRGETVKVGAEYSDPAAAIQQIEHGGSLADRSMHLWRSPLPHKLKAGQHTATVTATDVHGRTFTETIEFTVTK
ncbi:calcineurin-like phosphoesterase C-terminal domain-containing protein [Micrococcoides hystricis]|uniref:Calcineurin-like phosphoesterase C-terminal domain-containing protein n=1 Tax=Micrococcoides hystricis TaxID=1572761 RepID=A0ABV6PD47_9MICC